MPNDTEQVLAISFGSYRMPLPGPSDYEHIYRALLGCFDDLETKPTYFRIGNLDDSPKMKKWGGTIARQIAYGFADVDSIILVANPAGSTQPAYDMTFSIGFGCVPSLGLTSLDVFAAEPLLPAETPKRNKLIRSLSALWKWDFGYGFSAARKNDPDVHLMGGGSPAHSKEETRRIGLWYAASAEQRLQRLRDVYAYNFLNSGQLAFPLSSGTTLRDFAGAAPHSKLTPISPELTLWEVEPEAIARVRQALLGAGILITE